MMTIWGKIRTEWNSCPPGTVRLAMPLYTSLGYSRQYRGIYPFWMGGGGTLCEVFAGVQGDGPLVGISPLPKKILYLMGIRYIISFPIQSVKNLKVLRKNIVKHRKSLLEMKEQTKQNKTKQIQKQTDDPPPLSAHQKSHGPPPYSTTPPPVDNERS